jgi:hypothetical protein
MVIAGGYEKPTVYEKPKVASAKPVPDKGQPKTAKPQACRLKILSICL